MMTVQPYRQFKNTSKQFSLYSKFTIFNVYVLTLIYKVCHFIVAIYIIDYIIRLYYRLDYIIIDV